MTTAQTPNFMAAVRQMNAALQTWSDRWLAAWGIDAQQYRIEMRRQRARERQAAEARRLLWQMTLIAAGGFVAVAPLLYVSVRWLV